MGNSASTSNVAGDVRPVPAQTTTAAVAPSMGNVSSPIVQTTPQQQQALSNMSSLDVVHSIARNDMKNGVPTRPERLGDAVPIVDQVKQAEAVQRAQDAKQQQTMQQQGVMSPREPANVREGKYSIYNNPVACNRMPNTFPLDNCLLDAQHQFYEAKLALRFQKQMCLPCNQCYGDYNGMGGGNVAKAFSDNNVRGARTNDGLMSRDYRTMSANLQARQRLMQSNARPTQLEHSEQTTKMSPAASAIEALASQTTNSAQERNAAAVEAVLVEQSMSPSFPQQQKATVITSPAMTATAASAASNVATVAAGATPQQQQQQQQQRMAPAPTMGQGDWQQDMQGGGAWKKPGCGCRGVSAPSPSFSQQMSPSGSAAPNRLLALKRMQQGIQARQDFCEFDFCPVV